MTRMVLFLVVLSTCICCLPAARDNKGTEFILTFPENVNRIQHNPKLFIACSHQSGATVTVTTPSNGVSTTVQVTYGQVKQVELDREAVELRGSVKSDKAVHVTSDVEIVVYGIFAERRSTDAFLALPTDVLGTEYFTPCTSVRGAMPAEFGVVGVHDGTTVTIVPSQAVTFDGQNYAAGQTFSVGLDRFETLQVQATEDLTGSEITADQPVAVLSGNMFASCKPIGQEQGGSGDHIVEMIPPVDTWGKEFVTVPLTKLTGGDLFRVVAARDNTLVAVTNEGTNTLNAGEFWEFDVPSDEYRHVTSSEPVLLVQYSYGFTHTESYGYPGGLRLSRIAASCSTTIPVPDDRVDNDCDGRVDEELLNGIDDDGDGLIDEDMAIGNCGDNRDQYRTCLQNRCRNLLP
uniref:IgGFc-binding protein N-terminal domain-containing protein n=1 Tax=Branchiostoma floridae TaxID=7739 RepID=C3Z5G5_BRAFL|eukprot:XP_002596066.1 hypothetical protein BRAFLDRAFT_66203 [Branchiostoma floridae]